MRVWLLMVILATQPILSGSPLRFADILANPQKPSVIEYARRGDRALVMYAFPGKGETSGVPAPALVLIHGGGWVGGTPDAFMLLAAYFAERGLRTFNVTYRLAKPGESGVEDCLQDCRTAMRYLRAHSAELGIDPHRIAVLGDSAGGHLAAALGTIPGFDHPDDDLSVSAVPDAMILYNPIVDMTEGEWIRFAVGGNALADRKSKLPDSPEDVTKARSLSPLFHVASGQPPALLMHGTDDKVVPVSQAERFAAAAAAAGNRCDLILLPQTSHAFVVPNYKSPEEAVVSATIAADHFLESLGWIHGKPTLVPSEPPAWQPRK